VKLPFAGRTTASSLSKALAERDAAEAKLTELHSQRTAVLLDSDELDAVQAIDKQIEAARHAAGILADRILALDARLAKEAEQQRRMKYAEAIAVVERLLPLREQVSVEIETAMKVLAATVQKFTEINNSIVAQWPEGLGSRPDYHLSLRPLGERLKSCFAMSALIYATTHQPPAAMEFVRRACDAADRAEGFSAAASKDHAELIDELRQRGAPPAPAVDEEAA
jgi:hypothetical protein